MSLQDSAVLSEAAQREQPRRLGERAALGLVAAALVAISFTVLLLLVLTKNAALQDLDQRAADRLHATTMAHPALRSALEGLAVAAHPNVLRTIAVAVAIVLFVRGRRAVAVWLVVTIGIGAALSVVLKDAVTRARPHFTDPAAVAAGYSFPSGHALTSMLFACCVVVLLRHRLHGWAEAALWVIAAAFVLAVGYDRVALGVHYVSDVVAGWIVALAVVAATVAAFSIPLRRRHTGTARVRRTTWPRALGGLAWRLLVSWALVFMVMVTLGLTVTKVAEHVWPLSIEDGVNRALAAARTATGNAITLRGTRTGNTIEIIVVCAVVVIALRLTLHRWREPLFVACCTLGQRVVFMATTLVVDRPRPKVAHLDVSPPTSSFPSGHTSASIALYVSLALVLHRTMRGRPAWLRRTLVMLLCAVPVFVAVSRLYRGMHHPSDVVGSCVNAGLVIWATDRTLAAVDLPDDGPTR